MKDVKFDQLKAMLDYMYRGEVNISQDQLGSFLKAAESLQIKGLSDSAPNLERKQKPPSDSRAPRPSSKPDDDLALSRSSNTSPSPRRKKRRHLSGSCDINVIEENSCDELLDSCTPPPPRMSVNTRLPNPPSPPPVSIDHETGPPEDVNRSALSQDLPVTTSVVMLKSEPLHQSPSPLMDNVLFEPKAEAIESDDEEDLTQEDDIIEAGPSNSRNDSGGKRINISHKFVLSFP